MKPEKELHIPNLTVPFGIATVVVACAWCAWYHRRGTSEELVTGQGLRDLELFLAMVVIRHSDCGLEMIVFLKAATRIGHFRSIWSVILLEKLMF